MVLTYAHNVLYIALYSVPYNVLYSVPYNLLSYVTSIAGVALDILKDVPLLLTDMARGVVFGILHVYENHLHENATEDGGGMNKRRCPICLDRIAADVKTKRCYKCSYVSHHVCSYSLSSCPQCRAPFLSKEDTAKTILRSVLDSENNSSYSPDDADPPANVGGHGLCGRLEPGPFHRLMEKMRRGQFRHAFPPNII